MRTLLAVAARRPLIRDGFDRNDAATLGIAETGQAWTIGGASAEIIGLNAKYTTRDWDTIHATVIATPDSFRMGVKMQRPVGLGGSGGLTWNAVEWDNIYRCHISNITVFFRRVKLGVSTLLGSAAVTMDEGVWYTLEIIRIKTSATSYQTTVYWNGALIIGPHTDTDIVTGGRSGLSFGTEGGVQDLDMRYDDFIVRAA